MSLQLFRKFVNTIGGFIVTTFLLIVVTYVVVNTALDRIYKPRLIWFCLVALLWAVATAWLIKNERTMLNRIIIVLLFLILGFIAMLFSGRA